MTIPFRLFILLLSWLIVAHVVPQFTFAEEGVIVEGAGYTLHDAESIKGHDEQQLEKDPVCDSTKKPKILRMEPDEATPGHTITLTGENFGTRECFRGVAFSAAGPTKIDYKFVNDTTLEVIVPEIQPGMSFIDVVAGGGNARSKAFLVQPK
jgi:IPT/TIG domain